MIYVKSVEYIDDNVCRVVLENFDVLELDAFTVSQSGIEAEEYAEDEVIADVRFRSDCIKAQKTALKFLNTKMRTERQLRKHLGEKNVSEEALESAVEAAKQWGYIDDAAYARAYMEYRLSGSKKSWRAISFDLKTEGVAEDVIKRVKEEFGADEYERCKEVSQRLFRGTELDEKAKKKLVGQLTRNGFSWDTIRYALSEMEAEIEEE